MSWTGGPDQAELEAIIGALREQLGAVTRELAELREILRITRQTLEVCSREEFAHRGELQQRRSVDRLFAGARIARDERIAHEQMRFDGKYGAFWKCRTCGAYCAPAISGCPDRCVDAACTQERGGPGLTGYAFGLELEHGVSCRCETCAPYAF